LNKYENFEEVSVAGLTNFQQVIICIYKIWLVRCRRFVS